MHQSGLPLRVPNRSDALPTLMELPSHPLVPNATGRILYWEVEAGVGPAAATFKNAVNYSAPSGGPESLGKSLSLSRFLVLKPGDYLFARHKEGSGNPMDDVFVGLQVDSDAYGPELTRRAAQARERALGPKADVTPQKAQHSPGGYTGGLLFERSDRAVNVDGSPRAYTLGVSYETSRNMHAPAPGNKATETDQENLEIRRDLLYVSTACALAALKQTPQPLQDNLYQLGEASNVPCVGHPDNNVFPNSQLNVATPVPCDAGKSNPENDLSSSLGTFGGRHLDGLDSASSLTAMTNLSLFPPEIHPGFFYLYELGVCWELVAHSTIIFSGLRWHGGCSPTHPVQYQPPADAYRLCLIAYPPSSLVDGGSQIAFAAMPEERGGLFTISKEAVARPHHPQWRPHCQHANYVQDGGSLMTPYRHLEFVVRFLLHLVLFFVAQLPEAYRVRVDRDLFLSAFSLEVHDSTRESLAAWPTGPGWAQETEGESRSLSSYQAAWENLAEFILHVARTIPSVVLAYQDDPHRILVGGGGRRLTSLETQANNGTLLVVEESCNLPTLSKRPTTKRPASPLAQAKASKYPRRTAKHTVAPSLEAPIDLRKMATLSPRSKGKSKLPGREGASVTVCEPLIVRMITMDTLKATLGAIQNDMNLVHTAQEFPSLVKATNDLQKSLLKRPLSTEASLGISHVWKLVEHLSAAEACDSLHRRLQRQNIMLLNYTAWSWLEDTAIKHCGEVFESASSLAEGGMTISQGGDWFKRLVSDVHSLLVVKRCRAISLDAGQYIPKLEGKLYKCTVSTRYLVDDEPKSTVINKVREILRLWLGFSSSHIPHGQAIFIREVILHWGVAALLLDQVWEAHQSVFKQVFPGRNWRRIQDDHAQSLAAHLACHQLGASGSKLQGVLHEIKQAYEPYLKEAQLSSSASSPTSEAVTHPGPQASSSKRVFQRPSKIWAPLVTPDVSMMVRFLRDILPLIRTPVPPSLKGMLAKVDADRDGFLPFRTKAPGWSRMMLGPLNPTNLRTTKGLFSMMVWRAITFRTPMSHHHPVVFDSLQGFMDLANNLTAEYGERYCCRQDAYGPTKGRSIHNAAAFWDYAQDNELNKWLIRGESVSFRELHSQFLKLPSIGDLTAFLLAVDYAEAHVIPIPSPAEMGSWVAKLGKGASSGLEVLGYNGVGINRETIKDAFQEVCEQVDQLLTLEEKALMGYNPLMLEHALCKIKKLRDFLPSSVTLH